MTYYKVPQFNKSGTNIQDGGLEVGDTDNGTVDFIKKLVFAASFTPNAVPGHYTTSVLLSLSADAKDVTNLSGLQTMQGMTPEICENTQFDKQTYQLTDIRDLKQYKVMKAADGNCWMNENLKLDLNGRTLLSTESNLEEDWPSTTGSSGVWRIPNITGADQNVVKFFDGTGGDNYKSNYGYYYSFQAAVANKGATVTSDGESVAQDICPKGWRLPKKDEYVTLAGASTWSWDNDTSSITSSDGTLSFSAAGYVADNALKNAGSNGYYWTSTIYNVVRNEDSYSAYFNYGSWTSGIVTDTGRGQGRSVRCIAKRLGDV